MDISANNLHALAQTLGLDLAPLSIPVPPSPLLERAVGYRRGDEARLSGAVVGAVWG